MSFKPVSSPKFVSEWLSFCRTVVSHFTEWFGEGRHFVLEQRVGLPNIVKRYNVGGTRIWESLNESEPGQEGLTDGPCIQQMAPQRVKGL